MGYYLVYQGKFIEDRLTLIGGYRWDRTDSRIKAKRLWLDNPVLELTDRNNPDDLIPDSKAPSQISPQMGASFAINDNVTVFGLYSNGLTPAEIDKLTGDGQPFDPVKATNREIGVKFEFLDGRISGSISAFRTKRENIARSIWWAPAPSVPAALSGHLKDYDPSAPAMMGFYSWGGLNPYYAWLGSKSDLYSSTPWQKIYPSMANILSQVPVDPVRTWGGAPLPLGATDVWATPSSQAVDASGNPMGMTLAELWTQSVGSSNVPGMPTDPTANPFMYMGAKPQKAAFRCMADTCGSFKILSEKKLNRGSW